MSVFRPDIIDQRVVANLDEVAQRRRLFARAKHAISVTVPMQCLGNRDRDRGWSISVALITFGINTYS
jgi:hypothetical protein